MTAEATVDSSDFSGLVRRKLGFVGFSQPESRALAQQFAGAKCLSRALEYQKLELESRALSGFDLLILNAGEEIHRARWSPESMPDLNVPVLLAGPPEDAPGWAPFLHDQRLGFLSWPGPFDELLRSTYSLIIRADEKRLSTPQADARVLVADDDPRITSLLRAIFTNLRLECQVARNGREALSIIRTTLPDLVFLDINMPGMSGFDVLSAVRGDPGTQSTLIVLLTASHEQGDILKGSELKADDYVVKPFGTMDLSARTKKLLQDYGASAVPRPVSRPVSNARGNQRPPARPPLRN